MMTPEALEKLKYPIGQFKCPNPITEQQVEDWIMVLETLPSRLDVLVSHLNDEQLNTPYRPEGWTIRQVIHHIADSHHHSYIRFKWAMTEYKPLIKAYNEQDWANQFDYNAPIAHSLLHIKAIHAKLVYYLKGLTFKDLDRSFIHPETNNTVILKENVGIYAWHSNHHYAHIETVLKQKEWLKE